MKAIISTIEELKSTVKVNAVTQFSVVAPYIQQARDIILVRYLGLELIEVLEGDTIPDRATELLKLTQCALGPLAIWCGNAEMSVRFSDSGFTVAMKAGEYGAASDTKIAKVEESLERRGFQYLDQVLEYLEIHSSEFPEWTQSRYYTLRGGNYIQSATQFQEIGLVDIDHSRLTFESLRPIMSMIEMRFITELLGETLNSTLRSKLNTIQSVAEKELIGSIRRFVACKTAEIHTSKASKANRSNAANNEYKPVIRPLYSDIQNEGNYFTEQGDYFYTKIKQTLNKYAAEFGIESVSEAMDFNSAESKIFNSFG